MVDVVTSRIRRDVLMFAVGALFGTAIGAGIGLVVADDDSAPTASSGEATETTEEQPAIDPTDTEFGELTDEAAQVGVKTRWTVEVLEGSDTGTVDFEAAQRGDTTVLVHEDVRLVDDGTTIRLCTAACERVDAERARKALPEVARPYWEIIRMVQETTAAPQYRITGETQLESGIFQRCGTFDAATFGIVVPDNVVTVSQCVDAERGVPISIGLNGQQRSVGGGSLTALADADPAVFRV